MKEPIAVINQPFSCSQCDLWPVLAEMFNIKPFEETWENSHCWDTIQLLPVRQKIFHSKRLRSESIWSARQAEAVDCKVSETYLTQNMRFLSCFFRPICHFYRLLHIWQAILAFMLVLTVRIRKCVECRWMPFHFGPSFHVSSDQQDSRICRHIECSLMVFHLGADFYVFSYQ